jgi:hypothetical protein
VGTQAYKTLVTTITCQVNVLAYQDGFIVAAIGAVLCPPLVALMRPGRPSSFWSSPTFLDRSDNTVERHPIGDKR